MVHQIFIGTILILITIVIAAIGFWIAEGLLTMLGRWLVRRPHAPKLALVLIGAVLMVLTVLTASVWVWALAFVVLDVFDALEPATYFSIVAFTTLGFGDILLPLEWRILGGMAAANGLLNMGLFTAMLVEILRRVRSEQVEGRSDEV
ncbi:ion channel [Actibacterium lipolyticum]|uniref:Ion channel n=1 Tax=Actibacterium lipolyticum TaxID=1524263 RepID=A0A238KK62_9RHOB|nr:ion channel [Actibacterium lipolyticum]SMX43098.1 Ion channel [Actibacterium lipolyticum]